MVNFIRRLPAEASTRGSPQHPTWALNQFRERHCLAEFMGLWSHGEAEDLCGWSLEEELNVQAAMNPTWHSIPNSHVHALKIRTSMV